MRTSPPAFLPPLLADRKFKAVLYAAVGIDYCSRIELEPAPRLLIGRLRNGSYADQPPLLAGAVARIDEPFPIAFDPARLVGR
ncbi:hypothetical protein OHA91_39725 (plasmid) [Streptomyces erythrochromogenes]|uniref:Uncharacterized protein n=1 Tax=Streptomyces erythrochromogenes TaxID=285574 RepID=A0ABZ1QQF6_9ACTN|nr:hypothetical protein [Streptomyces erythrochromogenes]